jgi:Tfp pilus assembly protein PilN
VVLALLYTGIQIQLGNYSKRIEAGQSEYGALQHDLKKMDEQRIVNKLMNNQPYWEDVLKELSNIIPGEMYLEEITMDRDKIYFVGIVFGDEKEKSCSNLMRTMEEGIFKNVTLVSSQEMPGGLSSEIELRAEVD